MSGSGGTAELERDLGIPVEVRRRLPAFFAAFVDAVRRCVGRAPSVTVLFSGGVDSSFVAHVAAAFGGIRLLTVGVRGSRDLIAASTAAETLGLPHFGAVLDDADLSRVSHRWAAEWDAGTLRARAPAVALAAALEQVHTQRVLCGQGADELFWGYAHFVPLPESVATLRAERDWVHLVEEDWPRTARIAASLGRELHSPFLDESFSSMIRSLPPALLRWGTERKPLLRALARSAGVPELLAASPKRAIQYGSGVDRWLRRRARSTPPT